MALAVAGAVTAVVVGTVGIVAVIDASTTDAQDVVVRYLDAIAEGDVAAANALDGTTTQSPGSLDDAERITQVQVAEEGVVTSPTEGAAPPPREEAFDVSYVLAGERFEATLSVVLVGTDADPRWELTSTLASEVELAATYAPADFAGVAAIGTVAGERVDLRQGASLRLYPGVYPVAVEVGAYADADDAQVTAGGDATDARSEILVEPSAEAAGFVQSELVAALEDCVDQERSGMLQCGSTLFLTLPRPTVEALAASPFAGPDDVDTVTWSVEQPTVEQPDPGAWSIEVSAVVRASFVLDGVPTSVDYPVRNAWGWLEQPGEQPTVLGAWLEVASP